MVKFFILAAPGLPRSACILHCGKRISLIEMQNLLVVVGWLLLEQCSDLVVVHGLSRPVACGSLAPQPGIEPASPALKGRYLTSGCQESPDFFALHFWVHSSFKTGRT